MELLEAVEPGDRGFHELQRAAVEARDLYRHRGGVGGGAVRRDGGGAHAGPRRFARRLPEPARGGPAARRYAVDLPWRDRRVSGARVQRDETSSVVPGGE